MLGNEMDIDELCRKAAENCCDAIAHWQMQRLAITTSGLHSVINSVIGPVLAERDAEIERLNDGLRKTRVSICRMAVYHGVEAWPGALERIDELVPR